ncbi:MAG: 30S ribosome-binding factor RbfA [Clostridia bacterium]|nr:30S ribosome-binding factor RbfA [Clostridia bacterium]
MERTDRIAEEIKKVISEMIQNELKDPRVKGLISVTKINLTKDLKFCKIYISVLGADKEEVLAGIKSGAGYMRKELGQRVQIRILPELQFVIDNSMEYGAHIDQVIKGLNS